jgi:hypothetical protein
LSTNLLSPINSPQKHRLGAKGKPVLPFYNA